MFKVLLLGCGNIGALYDLNNDKVMTHSKALSLDKDFKVTVYDKDINNSLKVNKKYNFTILDKLTDVDSNYFDIMIIATPTGTHYKFLKFAIDKNVKTIICEKPISMRVNELDEIERIYKKRKPLIFVNYFRRFLPSYQTFKQFFGTFTKQDSITQIIIKYQRGFLNNCSHAIDLLQYILNEDISIDKYLIFNTSYDHFSDDPTISLAGNLNGKNILILGLTGIKFSLFEIEIFMESHRIFIKNSGDTIEFYTSKTDPDNFQSLIPVKENFKFNCIDNYMNSFWEYIKLIINRKEDEDNFINSLKTNRLMLQILDNK